MVEEKELPKLVDNEELLRSGSGYSQPPDPPINNDKVESRVLQIGDKFQIFGQTFEVVKELNRGRFVIKRR